ncbi:HEAT repeat domain-containing protein [Nodosilinea sp. LEGE 07088]|uniref:HEAT repeat domain-containing protein n=1 Tax=Nodosilinea sp. LEGE 07088 TaxID=2777968 RepID=UPI001882A012|nr:HEAT repeat domain-containing protein [Nodosilinea sp. LEGE 07088]MBE9137719.1 HEAT repeat domain-containing protein [Nodosilinea sp. LEGE 07088]
MALKPLRGMVGLCIAVCAYITGSQSTEAAPPLQPGDSGTEVEYLKDRLRKAWCLPQVVTNADSYDELTVAAVKSLQRQHGLLMNGVVDEQTAKAIEDGKMCYAPEDSAALKLGDEGEEVRLLKTQLKNWGFPLTGQSPEAADTNKFDQATQNALKEFETFFGLKEDGIFDPLDSEVLWSSRVEALVNYIDAWSFKNIAPALRNLRPAEKSQAVSTAISRMESGGEYTDPTKNNHSFTYSAMVLGILNADAQESIPTLIALLSDNDASIRASAAEALSFMGANAQEALPRLIELSSSENEDPSVRNKSVEALGYIGDSNPGLVVPSLLAIANDKSVYDNIDRNNAAKVLRWQAAAALGNIGVDAKQAIPDLVEIAKDRNDDDSVRSDTAAALGSIGADARQAVPALIEIAEDKSNGNDVRGAAIEALGDIEVEADRVMPSLLAIAKDKADWDTVRRSALSAIGKFGPNAEDAVDPLIELLNDKGEPNLLVIEQTIDSLGEIGPAAQSAVPTLITLFDDWEYPQSSLAVQEQSLNDEFAYIRDKGDCFGALFRQEKVALAIASIGPRAVPELIAALQHPDEKVRYGAAFTLGEMPPDTTADAVEPLQAVMNNQNENINIRWRAASTLQDMGVDTQDFFSQNNLEDLSIRREKGDDSSSAFNQYIGEYIKYGACGDDGQTIADCFRKRSCN